MFCVTTFKVIIWLNITIKSLLDGVAYVYEDIRDDKSVQQFLPSDYCRTRTMDNYGNKIVEFNFKYFDETYREESQRELIFKQLPKEFKKLVSLFFLIFIFKKHIRHLSFFL